MYNGGAENLPDRGNTVGGQAEDQEMELTGLSFFGGGPDVAGSCWCGR